MYENARTVIKRNQIAKRRSLVSSTPKRFCFCSGDCVYIVCVRFFFLFFVLFVSPGTTLASVFAVNRIYAGEIRLMVIGAKRHIAAKQIAHNIKTRNPKW